MYISNCFFSVLVFIRIKNVTIVINEHNFIKVDTLILYELNLIWVTVYLT